MQTFLLLELFLSYGQNSQQTLISDFSYFERYFSAPDVLSLFILKEYDSILCLELHVVLTHTKLLLSRYNCKSSWNHSYKEANNCPNISFVLLDGLQITLSEREKSVILRLLNMCTMLKPISICIFCSYALFSSINTLNYGKILLIYDFTGILRFLSPLKWYLW